MTGGAPPCRGEARPWQCGRADRGRKETVGGTTGTSTAALLLPCPRVNAAMRRPAKRPKGIETPAFLRRLIGAIRANWPQKRS
jgi:hypothetical protein